MSTKTVAGPEKEAIGRILDSPEESGVLGRLEHWRDIPSEHLVEPRTVTIWLPPGYDEVDEGAYPVVYMHDGQNLFDPRLASTGVDWGVDEAIVRGMHDGTVPPAIVVGVWNTSMRVQEYSPRHLGPQYARFLIEELMPEVNSRFRVLREPEETAVMGSSMGGLISFWLCREHPDVFSRGGCISTHWPWNGAFGDPHIPPLVEHELQSNLRFPRGVRLYFDYGTRGIDAQYEPLQAEVTAWLEEQGFVQGNDFLVRKFPGADHNEAAWRARLDLPLRFLLGDTGRLRDRAG